MKALSLFLSLIYSSVILAAEWKITQQDRFFFLEKEKEKYALKVDIGTPKFVAEKKLNKNYTLLVYKSGEVGTSKLILIERCLIFKKGKYVGNVPYRYLEKGTETLLGPEWKISANKVEIIDQEDKRSWSF